jgi:hypothetical protein
MRLTTQDVIYSLERDGQQTGIAVAFVIDGDVVYADAFSPSAGAFFLTNPTYSSFTEVIDENEVEIVRATDESSTTELILNELFTAVLLSEARAIRITRERSRQVATGWKHDDEGFYIMQTIDGVERRIDGMGRVV